MNGGGGGFVPGRSGGGPPPSPNDVLVGKRLFVSTEGHPGGLYQDLSYHFNSVDAAIAALTGNDDVIEVYSSNAWTITTTVLPAGITQLNIHVPDYFTRILWSDSIPLLSVLNISGNGHIVINNLQPNLAYCNIQCGFLQGYSLFYNNGEYDINCSGLCFVGMGLSAIHPKINIIANKMESSVVLNKPQDGFRVNILCNDFKGIFVFTDSENNDWQFNMKCNNIHYENLSNPTLSLFKTNVGDFLSRVKIEGNIYYTGDTPMVDCEGTTSFGFRDCTFTQTFISENTIPVFNFRTFGNTKKYLYLKNCDIKSNNSRLDNGIIYLNNQADEVVPVIIETNVSSDIPTPYIIVAANITNYLGIGGTADENIFDDWISPNITNIAGLPGMQLVSVFPNL